MPILTTVEAKTAKGRLLHAGIVLALCLGGLTMVYPFAIMISGSMRSEMDEADLDLVPGYFVDDHTLYHKYLETKYNQSVRDLNRAHRTDAFSFRDVPVPPLGADHRQTVELLRAFMERDGLPDHWQVLGGAFGVKTVPENLRQLRRALADRFDGNLDAYTRASGTPLNSWLNLIITVPAWTKPRYELPAGPLGEAYRDALRQAPLADRQLVSLSGEFLDVMVFSRIGRDLDLFRDAFGLGLRDWSDFHLPDRVSRCATPALRSAWVAFVRNELNTSFIAVADVDDATAAYRRFLGERYGTPAEMAEAWRMEIASPDDVELPQGRWVSGSERQDYAAFLATRPDDALRLVGPEQAWARWQADRAADAPRTPLHIAMPLFERAHVAEHRRSLRWAYAKRNFVNVWDELALEGRALRNTVILCALSILAALLINPLAAYALSRFKLPGGLKFLLVLMATMAFPPMVTLIPQFIMLRELGLINTFIAMLLPLAINGYLIFLLKGFFDSLPGELYEAATIDGAGEVRIFFQITMSLSKPILAVLALNTFTSAYTMFLYALIVAPDADMWLISVWLYQFQQRSGSGGVYASVLVASIPTLLIFLFVQRTIMRGIVVPTEK